MAHIEVKFEFEGSICKITMPGAPADLKEIIKAVPLGMSEKEFVDAFTEELRQLDYVQSAYLLSDVN
jgi:hypothetical protein